MIRRFVSLEGKIKELVINLGRKPKGVISFSMQPSILDN